MRPYHVAIVGSGPSGYFAAASLLKYADAAEGSGQSRDVRVDMLEMLPTPWGLVRSGVAPDHPKIKTISAQFEKTALDPRFRFFGNIKIGEHVEAAEVAEHYDAVVYAIGAQADRPLGIPGEELEGSIAAVDFVGWYNAHPHFEEMAPDLSTGRAIVVGNGNVALDVARILVSDPDVLAKSDIADHALESLHGRGVEEVVVIGRRGPLQATFTTLELRELGDLEAMEEVDVIVDLADFDKITDEELEAAGKTVKQNIKVMRGYAETTPRGAKRRIVFRFQTSPIELKGDGCVESIVLGHNELVDDGGRVVAKDTGAREELPAQLVVRAVGYRGVPTPGLPFDDRSGTIPHTDGRVDDDVDVAEPLQVAELAQLQRGERGLQRAASPDDEDLFHAAVVQRLQRVVGDVGGGQHVGIGDEDARYVQCDVAVADDDGAPARDIRRHLLEVGVGVVPADEVDGRHAAV